MKIQWTQPATAMRLTGIILTMSGIAACSYSTNDYIPTPRRRAYPRVELIPTDYVSIPDLPLNMDINSGAGMMFEKRSDGSVWLNLEYPRYGATIYCTLTPASPASVEKVIANRLERMKLNLGDGRTAESIRVESEGGFEGNILRTGEPSNTPLQFISTDRSKWVVSGTVWMPRPGVSADSIEPYINALSADVVRALESLTVKK